MDGVDLFTSVGAWRSNRPVPPARYQMNLYWWCTLSFVQCYMNPSRAGGMMLMTVGGGGSKNGKKSALRVHKDAATEEGV